MHDCNLLFINVCIFLNVLSYYIHIIQYIFSIFSHSGNGCHRTQSQKNHIPSRITSEFRWCNVTMSMTKKNLALI